jgi:hypothetical protein
MKNYVLKSEVNGLDAYFDRLSVFGLPLNDDLRGAKRFGFAAATRMAAKLNAFLRSWPDFQESWLYKVTPVA